MRQTKEKKSQRKVRSALLAKTGQRSRRKGHNYERTIVKYFKDLGYTEAKTSRLASRLLDSAKIDICDIPFNVQCKAVEANINYQKLTEDISTELKKLLPQREEYPIMIFHKKDRKTNVVMTLEEFTKLLNKATWR